MLPIGYSIFPVEPRVLLLGSAGLVISVLALTAAGLMIYGVVKVRFLKVRNIGMMQFHFLCTGFSQFHNAFVLLEYCGYS
jgi:hypothetical protein